MTRLLFPLVLPGLLAVYMPFCTPAIFPTASPGAAQREMAELWHDPGDVGRADLANGPWGKELAPDPHATYTFKHLKTHGASPGMTIYDAAGRQWSVKQGPEAPVEVVTSRVLSALGYHQPPVYFLATVDVTDETGTHLRVGGRFRPKLATLKDAGHWSWQQNPFVDTVPYKGLLVVLELLNSSDLKNSNNSLYRLKEPREGASVWYVVRDLGAGLGETGRIDPKRNDADLFARQRWVDRVVAGFVEFNYNGFHQELFHHRITTDQVRWACRLARRLSDAQWHDAFQSAGYDRPTADRFIGAIKKRIDEGLALE